MKLLQFTDIHLTTPGQTISGRNPNMNFERGLQHALQNHADAELITITGDLSDWGDREDYELLKKHISQTPIPVALCIGNHDNRETFLEIFPDLADENGFIQGIKDTSAGRCLFLDSKNPGTHAGLYCETRQAWLDDRLSEYDGPFFLFIHHNPMPIHLKPLDSIRLLNDETFRAVIKKHAVKIRHIFFGHCHLPLSGSVVGVPVSSLRSTNHQGIAVFSEEEMLTHADLPSAYSVAFIEPDYVTVHMIEFGYEGEIHTEGSPDYTTWDRATMKR